MDRFDPIQVRYVGNEFRRLVDLIASRARTFSQVSSHHAHIIEYLTEPSLLQLFQP